MSADGGVVVIDKPWGPTSHDVVDWVRWGLRTKSVGHCGTLDPGATGVLVVCVGWATRLVEYLTSEDKVYRARIGLGRATTTADADGETVAESDVTEAHVDRAAEVVTELVGDLALAPPAFSAVKVAGTRAHEMARAGKDPKLEARPMRVDDVAVLGHGLEEHPASGGWVDARFVVSKGTYIRSLAEELGRRTGLPTHLAALRRERSGRADLSRAVTGLVARQLPPREGRPPKWRVDLPEDTGDDGPERRERVGTALREALADPAWLLPFPVVELGPRTEAMRRLRLGQRLGLSTEPGASLARALAEQGSGADCASRFGARDQEGLIIVEPHAGGTALRPARVLAGGGHAPPKPGSSA